MVTAAKEKTLPEVKVIPFKESDYVSSLEASHIMLDPHLLKKEWAIKDEWCESQLKDMNISWTLTIKPNSFDHHGRIVGWSFADSRGSVHSHLELMIKNCGAAVWWGIDGIHDKEMFRLSEFIARNVASYTGTGVLIATGTSSSGDKLKELGWEVPIYRDSSRWAKQMAYGMLSIPKEQMKKYGYNHTYSTKS